MKTTHSIGDLGESKVMTDVLMRGYKIAFPFGHDWRYDLIVERKEKLERIQVKTSSHADKISVLCRSTGKLNGQYVVKKYTSADIDWIAVYDFTTDKVYYLPSSLLEEGKEAITLRLQPTKNNQTKNIKYATDFLIF